MAHSLPPPGDEAALPDEAEAVRARYQRRARKDPRYSLFDPAALQAWQERQRAILAMLGRGFQDPSTCRVMEVGSGDGGNLLDLLRWGFEPDRLAGIDLLPERHHCARQRLPSAVSLVLGDACDVLEAQVRTQQDLYDIVWQSTVFSSLLDDRVQQRLARAMWSALRPGGAVLWYDFTVDNPSNPDVRGVSLRRVRSLFPEAHVTARRLTLAPPLARSLARVHPRLCDVFNWPWLRTHCLAWLAK
ncbi:MAG: class I SAM-dependent methyltransferase [Pseudomonadota bacterium]